MLPALRPDAEVRSALRFASHTLYQAYLACAEAEGHSGTGSLAVWTHWMANADALEAAWASSFVLPLEGTSAEDTIKGMEVTPVPCDWYDCRADGHIAWADRVTSEVTLTATHCTEHAFAARNFDVWHAATLRAKFLGLMEMEVTS